MGAGASDSKYTRVAGIPSYGIDGMFDDLDDDRAHGRDERIGVAAFGQEVDFTYPADARGLERALTNTNWWARSDSNRGPRDSLLPRRFRREWTISSPQCGCGTL